MGIYNRLFRTRNRRVSDEDGEATDSYTPGNEIWRAGRDDNSENGETDSTYTEETIAEESLTSDDQTSYDSPHRRGKHGDDTDDDDPGFAPTRRGPLCWFGFLFFLLVVIFVSFSFYLRQMDYNVFKLNVCTLILKNDCGGGDPVRLPAEGPPILTEASILEDWIVETHREHVLESKFNSLDINYSVVGRSLLNTGNNFLGIYERDENQRPVDAGIHFLIAGSNGDFDARELYRDLQLHESQKKRAEQYFVQLHQLNGGLGFFRLGQMYMGDGALDFQDLAYPTTPPKFATWAGYFPNNFIVESADYPRAYVNMYIAVQCNAQDSYEWLNYIVNKGQLGLQRQALNRIAQDEIENLIRNIDGGIESLCEAETLRYRLELLRDPAVIWRFANDHRPFPEYRELIEKLLLPEPEFFQWIGFLVKEAIDLYGYEERDPLGSQYYRESPGADSTSGRRPRSRSYDRRSRRQYGRTGSSGGLVATPPNARDGLPDDCVGLAVGEECSERRRDLECRSRSEAMFKLGEAYLAVGNTTEAQRQMQLAISEGRGCQSEYARLAAKRLQAFNLTCEYTQSSLARISRDYQNNPTGGAVISLSERQLALRALRHYDGNIDGKYGPMTRRAVRSFQRGLGFEETGDLTPIETVYLICSAAEIDDDPISMNTLGKMYLTGLGTVQNTDAGLHWLKRAAGEDATGRYTYRVPNALFNLAIAYGTGTVASSYKLCGLVENIEQADQFLVEAANLGHAIAIRIINGYGDLPPDERWENLKAELQLDAFHRERMVAVGEGCRSNP